MTSDTVGLGNFYQRPITPLQSRLSLQFDLEIEISNQYLLIIIVAMIARVCLRRHSKLLAKGYRPHDGNADLSIISVLLDQCLVRAGAILPLLGRRRVADTAPVRRRPGYFIHVGKSHPAPREGQTAASAKTRRIGWSALMEAGRELGRR
jgi:hypothetical protein